MSGFSSLTLLLAILKHTLDFPPRRRRGLITVIRCGGQPMNHKRFLARASKVPHSVFQCRTDQEMTVAF